MLLKNNYYTLDITSHIWLKNTDDLFDFESDNKLTKFYSINKEDKENYIISFKENFEEGNDIISAEELKEKLSQNLSTKIISVLIYNNSTSSFSLINSFKRKNRDYLFTPKNCERIWTVIPQDDYTIIKEGDIIKLGRLRLKFDKINFSKNNIKSDNNLITSRASNTMINTMQMTTSNDIFMNINNNISEEITKNNLFIEVEKDKESCEKIYCRLCYQEESTILDPLLCPCKCKGSMRYIHYSCLKKSIMQKIQIRNEKYFDIYFFKSYNCEICLETYPKYIKYKSYIYNLVEVDLSKYTDYIQASIIYYTDNNNNGNNDKDKKQLSYLGYIIFNIEEKNEMKVGRNQSNEIVLKDISISRFHCVLKRENNLLKIKDSKSKFGTLSYIKNTKQIEREQPSLTLISGKHQFIFNLKYHEKMFGFLQNIFGNGCCSCNKKREKSELIMDKNNNNKKQIENNEIKDIKSINDSLIEYNIDEPNDYYNKFKDNDSYNDYVINMESIIGVNDISKDNNFYA
jgi:hypothetical protein